MRDCLLYQTLNFKWKMPTYLQKVKETKIK